LSGARLDAVYYCPHGREECNCRKPRTGMIAAAFGDFPGAARENSLLIGDSLSDIQCGREAGLATIFIDGETAADGDLRAADAASAKGLANAVAGSLADAVKLLL
jgi:D-glycero-D-manno-heptose 1,7-bisphosphate phosphatase